MRSGGRAPGGAPMAVEQEGIRVPIGSTSAGWALDGKVM
jgi:hypothetical protein